jgi:hypothetical protein
MSVTTTNCKPIRAPAAEPTMSFPVATPKAARKSNQHNISSAKLSYSRLTGIIASRQAFGNFLIGAFRLREVPPNHGCT